MNTVNDWRKSVGYINLSPEERKKIDALMIAGKVDDANLIMKEAESAVRKDALWGKIGSAAAGGADVLATDVGYDVSGRTEDLTSSEKRGEMATSALGMAGKGAAAGSAFGLPGMAVGAGVSGLIGLFKSKKANREAQEQIEHNRFDKSVTNAMRLQAEKETELKTGGVQYLKDGGFVKGEGGHADDMNRGKLDPGDYVVPAGTTPMVKNLIKDFAKSIDLDKEKSAPKEGKQPVKLSDGELIIPKEKVPMANDVLSGVGLSLDDLRETVNNQKGQRMADSSIEDEEGNILLSGGGYVKDEEKEKSLEKRIGMPSWVEPAGMAAQATSGLIEKYRQEKRIKDNIASRKKRVKDTEGLSFQTKSKQDEIVKRSFRDTSRTIDDLRREGTKSLAKSSLNPQDFNVNAGNLIRGLAETTSKANLDKSNQLTQNEIGLLGARQSNVDRLNQLDQSLASLNLAKATHGTATAQTSIQGLYDHMKGIKDEQIRRRKQVELIERARAMGSEFEMQRMIEKGDLKGIVDYYESIGVNISDKEAQMLIDDNKELRENKVISEE